MYPSIDTLVDLMSDHWTALGNVTSDANRASWRQVFSTFSRKIREHGTEYEGDWHVLSPETGAGKSEGLKLYAAETSKGSNPPGILIVVRLIRQADEFVRDINERAGRAVAIAQHSEAPDVALEDLEKFPVLVVCHAAFAGKVRYSDAWDKFMAQPDGKRRLVVIDEAIDVLAIARVQLEVVDRLIGHVPREARDRWPKGYLALTKLADTLAEIEKLPAEATKGQRVVMTSQRRDYLNTMSLDGVSVDQLEDLQSFMRSYRYLIPGKRVEKGSEQRQRDYWDGVLTDVRTFYHSFLLHHKAGRVVTLNTAAWVLPDDRQGCVVLDATADLDPTYELMAREGLDVLKHAPVLSRQYGNATLRCSFGHAVGRSSLTHARKGERPGVATEAPKLYAALESEAVRRADTNPMSRVLIVCHKDAVPYLGGFETSFEVALAHYGQIDGRNDWAEFDSVVIFGLDYRHPADAPAKAMALRPEFQCNDWLNDPSKRAYGSYTDVKQAIEIGTITKSAIQAVNRICARRVIDAEGNCPPCSIYVLLPENSTGRAVHDKLLEFMPGIVSEPWAYGGAKAIKRSRHEDALVTLARTMSPGDRYSATEAKQVLGVSPAAWKRLVPKMCSETSDLGKTLADLGVRYEVTGRSTPGTTLRREL